MCADLGVRALYLHVPFCARKCDYCDFASWATPAGDPLMGAYARALEAQLGEVASLGMLDGCETAYVGGGTPTLLGEKGLGRQFGPRLCRVFFQSPICPDEFLAHGIVSSN